MRSHSRVGSTAITRMLVVVKKEEGMNFGKEKQAAEE
jgi:hypothetical protein